MTIHPDTLNEVVPAVLSIEPQTIEIPTPTGSTIIYAARLAFATSEQPRHNHAIDRPPMRNPTKPEFDGEPTYRRCSACRWFEIEIYRLHGQSAVEAGRGVYLVHKTGRSVVDSETSLHTLVYTNSPYEVIEILTVRKRGVNAHQAFLPVPSARALALAAGYDADIREAYLDRAVV